MIDTNEIETAETSTVDEATTPAGDGTVAQARADVYGFLAASFDGDMETLASALADGTVARLVEQLEIDVQTDALDRPDLDAEALQIGYDNLFVVPGPRYVPPFASAHADEPSESFESDSPYHEEGQAGELLGDPAQAAAHRYATAGFGPERGDGVPDHVAATFEFLRALCEREAQLLPVAPDSEAVEEVGTIRALQQQTLEELTWLAPFQAVVAEQDAAEGLFAELTQFARTFVDWDREQLQADK